MLNAHLMVKKIVGYSHERATARSAAQAQEVKIASPAGDGAQPGIWRFPRASLGHAPTPLDAAPNLGAALGIELWIKRDDCTGLALGGKRRAPA